MSPTMKFYFVVLVLSHFSRVARACEGACITDTTKAFIGNYSLYHINPVFDSLADMIHSKLLADRPISDVHALIAPINSHFHNTIYDQTEKAIFPGYFHGKCQRVIDGVYKNPDGCPNPDCPVVCGTPGSMVHFYDKLVSIVFEVMQKALHTALPTSGSAYERLEQAVLSLATSSSHRRSSLYARSNRPKTVSTLPTQFLNPSSEQDSSSGQHHGSVSSIPEKESGEDQDALPLGLAKGLGGGERNSLLSTLSGSSTGLLGRSGLPVDPAALITPLLDSASLPVNPTNLLGRSGLPVDPTELASSLLEGLPVNPTSLLGRSGLPVDPTDIASSLLEGLPVNPTSLLGRSGLPADPTKLASSLLEGLPINPTTLLGRRSLPVDPTQLASTLLEDLPVNPTTLLGRSGLPVDPTELASSLLEGLPVNPTTLLGRRSLPVDPTELASSLLEGLPVNPTNLLGRSGLPVDPTELASSLLEGLPVNPTSLLGRSGLPVDPTELASSLLEGLPVNPTTLLGRRSLPVDPTELASSLLEGLPVNPTNLLGRSGLPVDPTELASSLLEGLPVNPTSLLGRSGLPVDPTKLASSLLEGLPINPTTLLGRRSLPVDPTELASSLLEGLPVNPTTLLGRRSLPVDPTELASSLLEGLPVNPTTLLGRRSLPVDPTQLASTLFEDLPVNPTTLLGRRSLPLDPTTLASSLLQGLPVNPTSLLGRSGLPVDPSSVLSSLPVNPKDIIEKNEMPKPLQSYTGSTKLPMDVKKVVPLPSLPVLSGRSSRRRSLPIDPDTLEKLTQIANEKNPLTIGRKPAGLPIDPANDADPKKILSKVDNLKHQDLTQLPSSRLVKDTTDRAASLPLNNLPETVIDKLSGVRNLPLTRRSRFRRVLRSGSFDDDEKPAKEDGTTIEAKDDNSSMAQDKEDGSTTTEDKDEAPVNFIDEKPEDEQTDGEDDADSDPTRRLAKREPQLELPNIADANVAMLVGSPLSLLSKRRLSHVSDQQISISLKKIIEECNRKFKEGCGSNLERCRWDKSMKAFILSFP